MFLLTVQIVIIFIILQVQRMRDAILMRRPEAVYNNLSVELNNECLAATDVDRDARRLSLALSFIFLVFWSPFYLIRGHYELTQSHGLDMIVMQIFAYVVGYFKSAVSPLIILIFYPESRILLRQLKDSNLCEKLMFWKRNISSERKT
jgi:hypothetical protein